MGDGEQSFAASPAPQPGSASHSARSSGFLCLGLLKIFKINMFWFTVHVPIQLWDLTGWPDRQLFLQPHSLTLKAIEKNDSLQLNKLLSTQVTALASGGFNVNKGVG